jgi:hypothetical protein|tara:strand:+ start:460 stop:1209 length:750 start_codon:yes stop_codon:yes gene_type:complete
MKSIIKFLLPLKVRQQIKKVQYLLFGLDKEYKGMNSTEVFDKIYSDSIWGIDDNGFSSSGGGSHRDILVNPYIESVSKFLKMNSFNTIVDLGCGDFNIGKSFVKLCKKYVACDISKIIIDRNQNKYNFKNLEFKIVNVSINELPKGDIAFVRQVLQHLSNDEIKKFVDKLNKDKPYRFLLVTEQLPSKENFKANLDKNTGANIRVSLDSGVELHKKPFDLNFKSFKNLCEINTTFLGKDSIIRSTLYEI